MGEFYEGAELLMFPPDWLDAAHELQLARPPRQRRCFLGIDVGEGGDETVWCVGDEWGVVHEHAERTPDTNVVPHRTREIQRQFGIEAADTVFDLGFGKAHADRMRGDWGMPVRTVAFGARVGYCQEDDVADPQEQDERRRRDEVEQGGAYKNRRAQMYWEASLLLDPARLTAGAPPPGEVRASADEAEYRSRLSTPVGYAIPPELTELRRQLAPIPKTRDGEGRLWLPPKKRNKDTDRSLTDIVGCSPDRADAFVMMTHLMIGASVESRSRVYIAGLGGRPAGPVLERVPGVDGGPVHFPQPGEKLMINLPPEKVVPHTNGNGKHKPKPPPEVFIPV